MGRITSPDRTVAVYPVRSDADIAVARLAADGIAATVHQDDEGGLNPGFFKRYGVRVAVRVDDLEDAFASLGIERVVVPKGVAAGMYAHAGWCFPEEACGLVAFDADGVPAMAVSLTNTARSHYRFVIDPSEHFGMIRMCEKLNLTVGGVFHSHPKSDAVPSAADISGGGDPDWIHFIVGPVAGGRAFLRAFRVVDDSAEELSIVEST